MLARLGCGYSGLEAGAEEPWQTRRNNALRLLRIHLNNMKRSGPLELWRNSDVKNSWVKFVCSFWLILFAVLGFQPEACAEGRVALVIGNAAYVNAPALHNSRNDADDMSAQLQRLGFEVVDAAISTAAACAPRSPVLPRS